MNRDAGPNDPVAHLRAALAEDAFTLYLQPIGLIGKKMIYPMGEVLVRLREEEEALMPPGEFLPVLEHYGMMPEFDRWVVRQVLRRLAAGFRIPRMCVNLSAQTVADPRFPAFFADELATTGVAGDCVLFEIEETDAVALPDCLARFAATIGSLGTGIIIDGFGRTPECLEPLRVPCVTFVKLHGSLTRRLMTSPTADPHILALLHTTSARDIDLIAECVEDLEALPRLKALKIHHVQGFGVYQPHPIEAFGERPALQIA